jgi:two-component system NtrC family response regulator
MQKSPKFSKPLPAKFVKSKKADPVSGDVMRESGGELPVFREMIGTCPAMHQVFHLIRKAAPTNIPVLVSGADGTGKEMVARAMHQRSLQANGPFITVTCGAIAWEIAAAELFGWEQGAFPEAHRTVPGKVELADRGTLFLDGVGELPLDAQVKLFRVLEEYSFERLGGREPIRVDLRLIASTNRELQDLVAQGLFREDFYYRLKGVHIPLPDLKDRGEDVLIMAQVFLRHFASLLHKRLQGFSADALLALQTYAWPGNVRELINHIRRGAAMAEGGWVTLADLGLPGCPPAGSPDQGLKASMARFEATLVGETLNRSQGDLDLAARTLKITPRELHRLMQKYGLR